MTVRQANLFSPCPIIRKLELRFLLQDNLISTEKSLNYSEISNTSPSGVKRKENHGMSEEIKNEIQTNIDEGQAQANPTDESLKTEETKEENEIGRASCRERGEK